MDGNIKTAAALLRKASYNLQYRAKELQSDEYNTHHRLDQEERRIKNDLADAGMKMATFSGGSGSYLVRQTYDLHKRRKQLEAETAKKISAEEREIHSLQNQARKLDQLAHTLETWAW